MPCSPYMLNLGFLSHPHGLEEVPVVHQPGREHHGEVGANLGQGVGSGEGVDSAEGPDSGRGADSRVDSRVEEDSGLEHSLTMLTHFQFCQLSLKCWSQLVTTARNWSQIVHWPQWLVTYLTS